MSKMQAKNFSFLLLILLLACTSGGQYATGAAYDEIDAVAACCVEPAVEYVALPVIQSPRFILIPESAPPGYPITVAFSYDFETLGGNVRAELLNAAGGRLSRAAFFDVPLEGSEFEGSEQAVMAAIIAVPSLSAFGDVTIRIESANGIVRELPFHIENRAFQSETIFLDARNTDIRIAPNPQRVAQSQHIWAVFNRTGTEIYSGEAFLRPVVSTRRTSPFGARRIFEYVTGGSDTTVHNGIDYGVPIGTDVFASARGRVVLSHYRIVTGYSIVIEHLPGVYSVYYHMDTLAVAEGELVEAGQFIGESGVTGLATGPHLHWEVRVSGEPADPDAFVARAVLDKNEIFRKLSE